LKLDKTKRKAAQTGFREGYNNGRQQGMQAAQKQFGTFFEGTSIIIPTYNQRHLLKKCIGSIMDNTDLPYEIVVVDNASTDGTGAFLQEMCGQVRFRVLDSNRGFAGAVNVGLMMAKGQTLVLLNNDMRVTHYWLDNMLRCLHSDSQIGMVGPVTNYIDGDQRIPVSYRRTKDMPAFARKYNRPDPKLWQRTDRLTGFCLLFRRELFEQVGFFDEGYEIDSFGDDDYNIRVRLLGKSLVIAKDTFIHHYGSTSMKAQGERVQEINDRNHLFFMGKWNNPFEWIEQARQYPASQQGTLPHIAVYYPERIIVQGMGSTVYWIENGERHPLRGTLSFPAVRVSQVDLRRWPLGEPVDYETAERECRGLHRTTDPITGVVLLPDGTPYHVEGNRVRRIISRSAMEAWNLHLKPVRTVSPETLFSWESGLPITAPPLLRQSL
jgi:O-antigen biosynthesis protein